MVKRFIAVWIPKAKGENYVLENANAKRVVDEYSDLALRLAYSYLRSTHDAADVCQNVLVKLIMRDKPFENADHERAWVIRVTINECKDALTKAERARTVPLDTDVGVIEPSEESDSSKVLAAVRQLPPDQALAVYLRYFEGYKVLEVAELLGKSEAAVSMALTRARANLRTLLGK